MIAIAVAGVAGLIAYFNAHDSPTASSKGDTGPGQVDTAPASAQLRSGNVLLEYSSAPDAPPLRAIARTEAGTDRPDASLVAAGQAVIVRHVAGIAGVVARAYQRTLRARSGRDPAVEDFVSAYLGQGAG